jgi:hypothetical protein
MFRVRGLEVFIMCFACLQVCCDANAKQPNCFSVLAERLDANETGTFAPMGVSGSDWQPTKAEIERGFAVGGIDPSISISPDWIWPESTPKRELSTFAGKGEYRNVAFAVRSLRALSNLQIKTSALRAKTGDAINPENIDIRIVRYQVQNDGDRKKWVGRFLEKYIKTNLDPNWTCWLWVSLYVPESAKAGNYTGLLTILDDKGSCELPVSLKVIDIKFAYPKGAWGAYIPGHFGDLVSKGEYANYTTAYWTSENLERYFKYWETRGFNSPTLVHVYPDLKYIDGNAVASFDSLNAFAKAIKAAKLDGPMCVDTRMIEWWAGAVSLKLEQLKNAGQPVPHDLGVYGADGKIAWGYNQTAKNIYAQVIKQLVATAEREKWPQMLLFAEEEIGYPNIKTQGYEHFMPVLRSVVGDRAYLIDDAIGYGSTPPAGIDRGARDKIFIRQYNNWTEEGLADVRKDKAQVWAYNVGWFRGALGLYNQRVNAQGYHHWADQWVDMAEPLNQAVNCIITSNGVISSVDFEAAHEGLCDLAYFRMLEELVQKLESQGHAQAAVQSRQILEQITMDVPINRYEFFTWREGLGAYEYDNRRWRVILAIQGARKILGEALDSVESFVSGKPSICAYGKSVSSATAQPTGKILAAPLVNDEEITFDGNGNERVWQSAKNNTGQLWWTAQVESSMRARAGTLEEFERMPKPSSANACVAYGKKGLYLFVAANHATKENALCKHKDGDAEIWADDSMEFFFKPNLPGAPIYQLIVNVCGSKTLKISSKVADVTIVTATASPINSSGGYSQEILVPWSVFGLTAEPQFGTTWQFNVGREFHSYRQITCWIQGEAEMGLGSGSLVFAGTNGLAEFQDLNVGSRAPGKNEIAGYVKTDESVAAGEKVVALVNENETVIAKATVDGTRSKFVLSYEVQPKSTAVTWYLKVLSTDKKELTVLPLDVPAFTQSIQIEKCPAYVISGQPLICDVMINIGDLSVKDYPVKAKFDGANGKNVFSESCTISSGGKQRLWIDTKGLHPGLWTVKLFSDTLDKSNSVKTEQVQILPF